MSWAQKWLQAPRNSEMKCMDGDLVPAGDEALREHVHVVLHPARVCQPKRAPQTTPERKGKFHFAKRQSYMKRELNQNLSGNEVYHTNSLILPVNNMLCGTFHCESGFSLNLFSYTGALVEHVPD